MYTLKHLTIRTRQYPCGSARYDMHFTSVKCGVGAMWTSDAHRRARELRALALGELGEVERALASSGQRARAAN